MFLMLATPTVAQSWPTMCLHSMTSQPGIDRGHPWCWCVAANRPNRPAMYLPFRKSDFSVEADLDGNGRSELMHGNDDWAPRLSWA